ncbi:MAG: DNA polymerase III subunit alpha [Candidatus Sungbacteria bacterium RIFCSPHIGHO2_01_FULL_50_25]|uniref:DNA polymerase III subunit alpha n=1 Tax=Candidatus Sungbacteria bacterium RIFCSPHIGHO2_01_FULL_50_25 TaxID=1802265 RepID=A0A1G2K8R8_9BACT|nr:MAG: DNA polymerase III subunit alpha [Candidatus Sungbacteria bacterium RIFCSPHIGHO2_01_FULL_50_25]
MKFTHLHVHSHYSLLDGLAKIDDLIREAARLEMDSLALTDHGNLYGAIEFYKKAKARGINPILGVEMYIAYEGMRDKRPGIDSKRYHLTLLATNYDGYKNLIKIVSAGHLEGFYYKPRVDKDFLRAHAKGLIALSGCLGGEIPRAIQARERERALRITEEYRDIFGKENFYLELAPHFEIPAQKAVNEALIGISQKTGVKIVAANDVHYVKPDDSEAQDIMVSIQTGSAIDDEDRLTMRQSNLSMRSAQEMATLFPAHPEAIAHTQEIASRVAIDIPLGSWTFPKLDLPRGASYESELRRIAYEGVEKRRVTKDAETITRLEYELGTITTKGFAPYFLVVADLLDHAHKNGILTNIRGSVAGSLVTYLIGITNIDPREYRLPFERFLNPERPSPPDIDMDFADNRRDEMIEYVKQKYGEDKVAQIGTFGTMMARAVVRDVARALKHPYMLGDRIAKLIPLGMQGFPMTIDQALELAPELKEMYASEPEVKDVIDKAKRLEGCVRHISVHAAGVVIAPSPLIEYVPLQFDPKGGKIITQYDMHAVEDAGLLKFDFLGIRNLSILGNAVRLVKEHRGTDVDIETIPLDDKKTFELLARGETMGLFQLGGSGMTKYLKDLKPTSIHDINAMVALYRPGPLESIPKYIERKHNPKLVHYLDPRMEDILDQSNGVITYQDDVLLIAIKLAGFSWLEADKLRKAMGKKIPAEMQAQKEKLIKGFIENDVPASKAHELWKLIEPFAAYGFNKAHAASYGRVAYQTAYMKANFPGEYMTAVLTADSGDTEKIAEIIDETKRMGIPVLPPDVNESHAQFTLIKGSDGAPDTIRFGLESVKNVGTNIVRAITDARAENGKFATITDFAERVQHKDFNKKSVESLAKCGALDSLDERNEILANLDTILEYNRESQKNMHGGQTSLFASTPGAAAVSLHLKKTDPATKKERLQWEKELLGLYVTEHPLAEYADRLKQNFALPIRDLNSSMRDRMITVAGLVNGIQRITTKKGEPMLFVTLEDLTTRTEILVFPKVLTKNPSVWQEEKILMVRGRLSDRDGSIKILCEEAMEIA